MNSEGGGATTSRVKCGSVHRMTVWVQGAYSGTLSVPSSLGMFLDGIAIAVRRESSRMTKTLYSCHECRRELDEGHAEGCTGAWYREGILP